ncbi:sigma factor [Pelagovum pacificum]|uniref:sigma factor n=1 Tax=Pelagovum pacificum TaxID=2588711 RepID=UPI0018CE81CF|nr:sigma factor [Pelagovum pacificum]QQA42138.1 hypothetical protein I8N54_15255 [Pelagovum pacificum]
MSALTAAARTRLLGVARRWSRDPDEAEDLLQDALVTAIGAGRLSAGDLPWIAGVIRNRARMAARSAARRHSREAASLPVGPADEVESDALPPLPPALARVARLAVAGASREEVRWLLGISDTALRQRLAALRRELGARPWPRGCDGAGGRLRPALKTALGHRPEARFASHDPDGHVFVIAASRQLSPRQQDSTDG